MDTPQGPLLHVQTASWLIEARLLANSFLASLSFIRKIKSLPKLGKLNRVHICREKILH